jgi:hypothetical protein
MLERGVESQTSLNGLSKEEVEKALAGLVNQQTVGKA